MFSAAGRRIDYVIVRGTSFGLTLEVRSVDLLGVEPQDGVHASNHYGVIAELSVPDRAPSNLELTVGVGRLRRRQRIHRGAIATAAVESSIRSYLHEASTIGNPMKYVDLAATIGDIDDVIDPQDYLNRLPELSAALPQGAAAYAAEPGHYDFGSVRCVHDLKLSRISSGEDGDSAWMQLELRHNCWKHEEDLTIRYADVARFTMQTTSDMPRATRLGEVILDEVLPDSHGCTHEIAFHTGTLTIVCADLIATWVAADCPDNPDPRRAPFPQTGDDDLPDTDR